VDDGTLCVRVGEGPGLSRFKTIFIYFHKGACNAIFLGLLLLMEVNGMKKSPMRRAREKAGLTLAAVSIGTGIPFSTIQAYEQGVGAGFSVEGKEKIAAFLGADFFILWPEERERMSLAFKAGMAAARKERRMKEKK